MSGFRTGILASARKMSTQQHNLVLENMNPCIKKMEYAVRGPLVIRATQIEKVIVNVQKKLLKGQIYFLENPFPNYQIHSLLFVQYVLFLLENF